MPHLCSENSKAVDYLHRVAAATTSRMHLCLFFCFLVAIQPSDVAVAMQNRRLSMPALEHQWQESQDHRHPHNKISPGHQHDIHQRPYSPGALHTILQTFRALHDESSRDFKAGPSGRHRHESISEENTEDSAWEPD